MYFSLSLLTKHTTHNKKAFCLAERYFVVFAKPYKEGSAAGL